MIIVESYVDIETPTGTMRTFIFKPAAQGTWPGVVFFSEIYQVTGPIARTARWLAGNGFLVAVPEVYHEFEPLGSPFDYDTEGTDKGNRYKIEKDLPAFDSDARAVLDWLGTQDDCNGRFGCLGICMGGHLSFRCAMQPDVLAGACLYATDIHKGSLGKGMADDSLARIPEIKGELAMVWGRQDRHVPRDGRRLIYDRLADADVYFSWYEFNARHAFVRDEGYRYDPALTRVVEDLILEVFRRRLQLGEPMVADDASTAVIC